jgi:superfamily II DNA or RNA helicase
MQSRLDNFKRQRINGGESVDSKRAFALAGVHLPVSSMGKLALLRLQESLCVVPRATYDRTQAPDAVQCYRLSEEHIVVPRPFGYERMGAGAIEDRSSEGETLAPLLEFKGALQPGVQEEACARSCEALQKPPHSCILTLPCGYGKTVVALKIAHAVGKKTLVVLHKEFLLAQWRARVAQFIPAARVGLIQGSKNVDPEADIYLGMLQTLCSRLPDTSSAAARAAAACGLVVIDEAHHMAARWFSELFFHLPCKRILGLTATPKRKDGCTSVLHMFMGAHSLLLEDRSDNKEVPTVRAVAFPSAARNARDLSAGETQRVKTALTQDPRRNRLLLEMCLELTGAGRYVLCLSDRVAHLQELLSDFQRKCPPGIQASLYVGGQKREERVRAETQCQMLFGTFAMAQEGLDVPRLDTLILASPASDITQAVGRILRPCADKQAPLVVDVQDDTCQQFVRQNEHRRRFYCRSGIRSEGESQAPLVPARE